MNPARLLAKAADTVMGTQAPAMWSSASYDPVDLRRRLVGAHPTTQLGLRLAHSRPDAPPARSGKPPPGASTPPGDGPPT